LSPRRAAPTLLVSLFAYAAGAGFSTGSDAALVGALKSAFHRVRPSTEIHHTFSFPSGHTTAATFMVGAALVVLLPLVLRLLRDGPGGGSDRGGGAATRLPDGVVFATWGGAVAMTAAGRVLADCHWVSDTAAGAALGVGCVCALAWAVETTEHALGNSGRSSGKRDNVS
jgi:membrane-associated phospholipid phosphatase